MLVEKGEGQMGETEPTIQATDEQVEFFCREGYLSIERITAGAEVGRMRAATTRSSSAAPAARSGTRNGHSYRPASRCICATSIWCAGIELTKATSAGEVGEFSNTFDPIAPIQRPAAERRPKFIISGRASHLRFQLFARSSFLRLFFLFDPCCDLAQSSLPCLLRPCDVFCLIDIGPPRPRLLGPNARSQRHIPTTHHKVVLDGDRARCDHR